MSATTSYNNSDQPTTTPRQLRAALAYASKGKPVFPCKPGDKTPLTPNGYKDASTNPAKITAWWTHWPNANIGIPTGKISGLLVLDVDKPEALDSFPELPPTATARTGRGGLHYVFTYPENEEIRGSVGDLADGLDIRGKGGYVIAPPSHTTGPYEWMDKSPPTSPPEWLLAALRKRPRASSGKNVKVRVDVSGPEIPQGQRNDSLTSIAGTLHDGTRSTEDLTADLLAINASRCTPPLPGDEVAKIAESIYRLEPCGPSTSLDPKVSEDLTEIEAAFWRATWRGMGGKSDRDVVASLITLARRVGRRHDAGVRVNESVRALALKAALSKRSTFRAIKRLGEAGWIQRIKPDNDGESGAFVLVRANCHHSTHKVQERGNTEGGATLRAPRLRWSAPRFERFGNEIVRTQITRLGKTAGAVIDALEKLGGSADIEEIARLLGIKRPRDLKRRTLPRLLQASVVECSGDHVHLTADWMEALDRERERAEEIAAYRRDMQRYNREREAYAKRHENKPDKAPTEADFEHEKRIKRDKALEAFRARTGAKINLELMMDGELHNVEILVKSVLHYLRVPFEAWELWRDPVLEAAALIARERAA